MGGDDIENVSPGVQAWIKAHLNFVVYSRENRDEHRGTQKNTVSYNLYMRDTYYCQLSYVSKPIKMLESCSVFCSVTLAYTEKSLVGYFTV